MKIFLQKKLTVFSRRKQSQEVFYKNVVLKSLQNPQQNIYENCNPDAWNFNKKETLA